MKQISIFLTVSLILFSSVIYAGGKKDKDGFTGSVKFKISAEGREITPNEQANLPTESINHYLGDLVMSENITPMGSMNTIVNLETKQLILLIDQMGQKFHYTISSEEMMKVEAKAKAKDSTETKPVYNLLDGTKTIAGYACKKAEMVDGENKMTIYYTEEIKAEQKEFDDAPGYILYFEQNIPEDDLYLVFQATEVITKKPKKSLFNIPNDYEPVPEAFESQIRASMGL